MDKRTLSERDICTKFITPALRGAGWDEMLQIREEVSFTKGRIIVRGKLVTRGQAKRAEAVGGDAKSIAAIVQRFWLAPCRSLRAPR
jgi:type I site-specific restriction endonuclease